MSTDTTKSDKDGLTPQQLKDLQREVERRRAFAIISHPDAGKTTLTEKLLLYGGAIEEAGAVKSRQSQRAATSDWMELEKQRGISITSTVLQFEFKGCCLNLLDTPGHQDFSEDTYRTLAAADNAVMLIDSAKGLEPQTRKLFEVCRMRHLPLFTFMNKLDRPGLEPLQLLDEIEKEFKLPTYAVNWPVGSGDQFQGVVDRKTRMIHLFQKSARGKTKSEVVKLPFDDDAVKEMVPGSIYKQVAEELDILDAAGSELDLAKVHAGQLTPVYFGSAANNFGVELFLESFIEKALSPVSFESESSLIEPEYPHFTGFVFKLQANMDPRHRDRIAFVRICSGMFEKGMVINNKRTGKTVSLNQPKKLFAHERESIEKAYPGDIIGLSNPGAFSIGDTLYVGPSVRFPGIPSFAPELFAILENKEPSKYKQFHKGITALQEEGAIQIMWLKETDARYPVLAAIGQLQFEVVQFRLESEYNVTSVLRPIEVAQVLWLEDGWDALEEADRDRCNFMVAADKDEEPVLLFKRAHELQWFKDKNPKIRLSSVSPRTLMAKR